MATPMITRPKHLDIKRDQGMTVEWEDGTTTFYPVSYLRKWSPSADAKKMREDAGRNPLAILPSNLVSDGEPLTITDAKFVGHYAVKLVFSDGHDTGLYSWEYLREIDPDRNRASSDTGDDS